jgi:hypothetical protein
LNRPGESDSVAPSATAVELEEECERGVPQGIRPRSGLVAVGVWITDLSTLLKHAGLWSQPCRGGTAFLYVRRAGYLMACSVAMRFIISSR